MHAFIVKGEKRRGYRRADKIHRCTDGQHSPDLVVPENFCGHPQSFLNARGPVVEARLPLFHTPFLHSMNQGRASR